MGDGRTVAAGAAAGTAVGVLLVQHHPRQVGPPARRQQTVATPRPLVGGLDRPGDRLVGLVDEVADQRDRRPLDLRR